MPSTCYRVVVRVQFRILGRLAPGRSFHQILELPVRPMKLLHIFPVVLIFVGAALVFERPAYAYADPGTGLLAVQAAGSALVATGWYLRRKIYSLFRSDEAPRPGPIEHSVVPDGEDSPNP
jgi:hypothetical protein